MKQQTLKSTLLVFLIATASIAGCLGSKDEKETSDLEEFVIAYSVKTTTPTLMRILND